MSENKGRIISIFRLVFYFTVLTFFYFSVFSYSENIQDISYLIVDKTKTPWGHKFFKTFNEIWKSPKGITGYFIIIEEKKPSFRQSWIYVKVGDNIYSKTVYVNILKPTTSNLDMQRYAISASRQVLKYLLTEFLHLKSNYEKF